MPAWNDLRVEVQQRLPELGPSALDILRRERLKQLADHTGRPVIVYAVEFLHQPEKARAAGKDIQIDWGDKEGFIEVTEGLPQGPLDLILHSPGGNPLAAESIVQLLRSKFSDVRVFVPNVAKSAATMIALSGDLIGMDERSELGPIDPQMVITFADQAVISPAQAILDQFKRASDEIQADAGKLSVWLPLLRQYGPSLLIQAENAIDLSKKLVRQWLINYMLKDASDAVTQADAITSFFGEHNNFLAHGRMIGVNEAIEQGVKVLDLRRDPELRRLVWEAYTMISLTLDRTAAYKIIENSLGHAFIRLIQQVQIIGNALSQAPGVQAPSTPPKGQPALSPRQQKRQQQKAHRGKR